MPDIFICCCGFIAGGGVLACFFKKNERTASKIGVAACITGLLVIFLNLLLRGAFQNSDFIYQIAVCLVGTAAAIHAPAYLEGHANGRTGFFWLCFNATVALMLAVTYCQRFIAFLIAWEFMGLFSFFLVAFDLKSRPAMKAAWIYLLACEAGGMLLMLFSRYTGTGMEISGRVAFLLLLVAFGLKCGFPLLHVWLPDAHPAAPAPVSALMSGAMIPLGFCGLFRFMIFDMKLCIFYGWTLLLPGMAGSFFGILTGLAQKDLKRLLAYSSVENIGIMAMGFGFGFLGAGYDLPLMRAFGFSGAFLHILNHALLKGSLFLSAGSVLKSAHTLNMEEMGGMMKKMPLTGFSFFLSALGICGLPPFCGFTGELLIYAAGFSGMIGVTGCNLAGCYAGVIILALTGAVACAALLKAFSAVFQGEPRTKQAQEAHVEDPRMNTGILLLLIPSLCMPFFAAYIPMAGDCHPAVHSLLQKNAVFALILFAAVGVLWFVRRHFGVSSRKTGTWDCGYAKPSARMEYTGTAFVQPLLDLFNVFFHQKKEIRKPEGPFPVKASYSMETEDAGVRYFWKPLFNAVISVSDRVHKFQSGYLHLYVLIMTVALILMLIGAFVFSGGAK